MPFYSRIRVRLAGLLALGAIAVSADPASAMAGGSPWGGRPSFDTLLAAFDSNVDDQLAEGEVPERVWARLALADADGDGSVTRDEFDSFVPSGGRSRS